MNPVTPEELFQIIGEQTVTIRKRSQQLAILQKEITELKAKETKSKVDPKEK